MWPVPGHMRTRAIDVLRRPVATVIAFGSAKREHLRPLRRVGMLGAGVDLELPEHLPAERVLREHPADRVPHDAIGVRTREQLARRGRAEMTRVAGVTEV